MNEKKCRTVKVNRVWILGDGDVSRHAFSHEHSAGTRTVQWYLPEAELQRGLTQLHQHKDHHRRRHVGFPVLLLSLIKTTKNDASSHATIFQSTLYRQQPISGNISPSLNKFLLIMLDKERLIWTKSTRHLLIFLWKQRLSELFLVSFRTTGAVETHSVTW